MMRPTVLVLVSALALARANGGSDVSPGLIKSTLQKVLSAQVQKYDMGAAMAFYSPQLGLITAADGFTDGGLGMGSKTRKTQADDVFVWGSTTKMFTGPAVLQLVDQGKVGIDDPAAVPCALPGVPL